MVGAAIAAKEKLKERAGSMRKGAEGQMAEVVRVTEEEFKEDRTTPRYPTKPTHLTSGGIDIIMNDSVPPMLKPFSQEYGTSQSVQDGLLPVHPLVLEVPATLRAATSMMLMMNSRNVRDASVDRIVISTGPAAQSSSRSVGCHILRPHTRICAALPPSRILMRTSRKSTWGRETAEMDTGICWGVLRPRALSTQPYDRHSEQVTPGQPLVREGTRLR